MRLHGGYSSRTAAAAAVDAVVGCGEARRAGNFGAVWMGGVT